MRRGNLLQTLSGHSYWIQSIAYSPDGQTLASGSGDKTIKLWDVKRGKLLQTLSAHFYPIQSIGYNPNGQTLASGSDDNTIKIWQLKIFNNTSNSSTISVNSIPTTTNTTDKNKNKISQKHPTTNSDISVVSVLARGLLTPLLAPLLTPLFNSGLFWVIVFGIIVRIFLIFIIKKK